MTQSKKTAPSFIEGWERIPGASNYEINAAAEARNFQSKKLISSKPDAEGCVQIYGDEKKLQKFNLTEIAVKLFPAKEIKTEESTLILVNDSPEVIEETAKKPFKKSIAKKPALKKAQPKKKQTPKKAIKQAETKPKAHAKAKSEKIWDSKKDIDKKGDVKKILDKNLSKKFTHHLLFISGLNKKEISELTKATESNIGRDILQMSKSPELQKKASDKMKAE